MRISLLIAFVALGASVGSVLAPKQSLAATPISAQHSHDDEGPNGGELLEVGKHEYHLELCLDEKEKQAVVYLLDKDVKNYVPVKDSHLVVNIRAGGKGQQLKLAAKPREKDPKGTSSRFELVSADLLNAIHDDKADVRIVVKFGSKQYSVRVQHHQH